MSAKAAPGLSVIKWKMACGIGMSGYHFITISDNSNDIFDIYPAAVFKQRHFRKSNRVILGIADSMKSARELVAGMIEECLISCGNLNNVRAYYEEYVKEHL